MRRYALNKHIFVITDVHNEHIWMICSLQELVSNPPLSPPMPPLSSESPVMASTPGKATCNDESETCKSGDCIVMGCSTVGARATKVKRRLVMQLQKRNRKNHARNIWVGISS